MVGCKPHFVLTIGSCECTYGRCEGRCSRLGMATAAVKAGYPISRPFNTIITAGATLEQ